MNDITECPICGSTKIEEQSEGSLHAFTINYKCGAEIIYIIGSNDYEIERNCKELKMDYDKNDEPVAVKRDTLSDSVLSHIKEVKENAEKLEGHVNRLTESYFGMTNEGKSDNEKQATNFESIIHNELNDLNNVIIKSLDFISRL